MGRVVRGLSIGAFSADHSRLTHDYLRRQEELGCIRPEWRFAWVDDDDRAGARVSYWGMPGGERPVLIDAVLADSGDDSVNAVLTKSLSELDIGEIDYQPTRPISGTRSPSTEPAALEALGFVCIAVQRRLESTGVPAAALRELTDVRLSTAADLKPELLLQLVASVQRRSADRATAAAGSRSQLSSLRAMSVVPKARGRALGRVLLARASSTLLDRRPSTGS